MTENLFLVIAAFFTSFLSAIIGMGGGITLLGIMAIIMPDGFLVVAYHGIIQFVSNIQHFGWNISIFIYPQFYDIT